MNFKALSLATLAALPTAVAFAPSASAQYYGGGYGFNNGASNSYGSYNTPRRSRPSVGSNSWYNNQAQQRANRQSGCSAYSMSLYC